MRYGIYILTICAVTAFLFCGQYGLNSYAKDRHLKAEEENLMVRTRLMKRQVAELKQKARILERVNHFMRQAREQRLTPEDWSAYEVQIHDLMAFQELSQIVEQCIHNKDIYFWPTSFHVTVDPKRKPVSDEKEVFEPVPMLPGTEENQASDVALALQGTFMVRH